MAGWWDDLWGKEKQETTVVREEPRIAPEYEESKQARQKWGETLTEWGETPGYGAIQPNWEDIWSSAKGKVRQYFGGGPSGPGAVQRMQSDAARRGMADQPSTTRGIARLGMQEGQMLQDIAVEQAMKEAMLGEQGRQTWLGSMQQLSGLKPTLWDPGSTATTTAGGGEGWDILGGALGMATSAATGGMPQASLGRSIYEAPSVSGAMGPTSWLGGQMTYGSADPGSYGMGYSDADLSRLFSGGY